MRVFISHSSNDAETANKICDLLESNGVQCWIAPRDISYGSAFGESIDYAFRECTDALFLLSSASLKSKQVEHELYLANLEHVDGVQDKYAVIHGERLLISRPRMKQFMQELTRYWGERS